MTKEQVANGKKALQRLYDTTGGEAGKPMAKSTFTENEVSYLAVRGYVKSGSNGGVPVLWLTKKGVIAVEDAM